MSLITKIAEFFHHGGWTMYVTASVGLVGLSIAIDKVRVLLWEKTLNEKKFMARIQEHLVKNRVSEAIQTCNENHKHGLPKVIKAGLERIGCDENVVRQNMESKYMEVSPTISERVPYLSLAANGGLLFGLLGTVLGLIRQFSALAADGGDKQAMMARGIAEAMNNTALGLMVALPMLIIHGVIAARTNSKLEKWEGSSAKFIDWVSLYNYGKLESKTGTDKK